MAWSINAAIECKYVDRVVVSTDSTAIAKVARRYGADTPFLRPKILASDTATTVDVVHHAITTLKQQNETFDYVVVLQPTSPLRDCGHLNEAVELLMSKSANGIVSVVEVDHPIEWVNKLPDDGSMTKFLPEEIREKRSQDFPSRYRLNGAIYLNKVDEFLKARTLFLQQKSYAYVMPKLASIDIDTQFDLRLAEALLTLRNTSN